MAILGTGRRAVNENGATADAETPKSRILQISFALDPLVRKGCAGEPTGFLSTRHFWIFGWPASIPSGHRALVSEAWCRTTAAALPVPDSYDQRDLLDQRRHFIL